MKFKMNCFWHRRKFRGWVFRRSIRLLSTWMTNQIFWTSHQMHLNFKQKYFHHQQEIMIICIQGSSSNPKHSQIKLSLHITAPLENLYTKKSKFKNHKKLIKEYYIVAVRGKIVYFFILKENLDNFQMILRLIIRRWSLKNANFHQKR